MTAKFNVRSILVVAVILGMASALPWLAGNVLKGADNDGSPREIRLVVRDMTFYVEGNDAPNPVLHARPGERLKLILRNTDPGMSHDFAVRAWKVKTRLLKGKDEDAIEFMVPNTRGAHAYSCTPHAEMMGGTMLVN